MHLIHFVCENKILLKKTTKTIPSIGDEIRIGGKGSEKFYMCIRRVWAYDEEYFIERVNIGVKELNGKMEC